MTISKEVKVGLLALISGIILYTGFNYLKGVEMFRSSNSYWVVYEKIDGLKVSNEVLINGLTVGRVSSIQLMQDRRNKMLVGIEVDADILLGDKTKAVLTEADILGGKIIDLKIKKDKSYFNKGDTLVSKRMKGMTDIIAEKAMPLLESIDTTFVTLNKVLKDYSKISSNIKNSLVNVENISHNLNSIIYQNKSKIETLMTNLNILSSSLVTTEKQLSPLFTKINIFVDALNTLEMSVLLEDSRKTLAGVQKSLDDINKAEGTIGKLLKEDSLYVNANKITKDLDSLLADFRKNPKRYIHLSLFKKKDKNKKKKK